MTYITKSSRAPLWSLDDIKARYTPGGDYRVSVYRFTTGDVTTMMKMRNGVMFALRGWCAVGRNGEREVFEPGDRASLAEGTYRVEVLGQEDVELVFVWGLSAILGETRKRS